MKRKYLDYLVEWKDSPRRKPLFVWGARQVGKTYLVEELFAKKYFKTYIRIDCSNDSRFVDFVFNHQNLDEVLSYLSATRQVVISDKTLIIFDEAQECLPIITMMKAFCELRREIPVIVTGSLVRIKINREAHKRGTSARQQFLFPVGKINQLYVYPLTFDEFLLNYNESLYEKLKDSYSRREELDDSYHKMYLDIFNSYLMIGGLPEVVDTYLSEKNEGNVNAVKLAQDVLKDVYDNYLDDMSLYQASPESVIRSKAVFENIYTQLNKENKNFKYSLIEKNLRNRDMASPIDWLTTANIVHRSYDLKDRVTYPLMPSNESIFRLYLSDMGLYTYQSRVPNDEFISSGSNTLSGYFYENYVAIELVSRSFRLFYWTGKNQNEFEFLIESSGHIIPIDVKKKRGSLSSLSEFRTHNKKDLAVKISSSKYGFDEDNLILNIPFFLVPFFLDDAKNGKLI